MEFEIMLRNGHPYLRFAGEEMFIYGRNTAAPYVKFMSRYVGTCYLTDEMKAELAKFN